MYTQCPHCDTLFRIELATLKTALGKVRCGQCGQIFNGLRYLSEALPEIPTVFETVELPAPPIEPVDAAADEMHSTEELLGLVDKLVSELEPATGITQAPEPMTVIPEDEAPLLSEITEFKQIDVYEVTSPEAPFESGGTPFSIVEPPTGVADEIATAAERTRIAQAQHHGGLNTLSWSVAILVLILALAAQYIYYMRAELSQNAVLHPWLERYCEVVRAVVPCELPPLRDVARIEMQGAEIVAHPTLQGMLVVRLSLVNKAGFTQPYPDLQLTLADLGERQFAQRRFHPAEYLPAGGGGKEGMVTNSVVPVNMEIAAPFNPPNLEATSWSIKLY